MHHGGPAGMPRPVQTGQHEGRRGDRALDLHSLRDALGQGRLSRTEWPGEDHHVARAQVPAESLNSLATGLFLVMCAGIAVLVLAAPQRPRLAAVLFLIVVAFVLTNKVYSPQYSLWLIPLAVLARPRWTSFLIWQAGEVVYFVAIWWYLAGYGIEDASALQGPEYAVAILVRMLATIYLAALVVQDMLVPAYDPVRSDGEPDDADDPGGGVYDGAPDRFTLRRS